MRKSLSTFLAKLLVFLVSVAAFDAGFSRLLDTGRPVDYRAFVESKKEFAPNGRVEVLFIGDSHIADAVDPEVIRRESGWNSFNFGVYHLSPLEGYFLIQDLLQRLDHPPHLVVLGTSPRMFAREITPGKYTPLFIRSPLLLWRLLAEADSTNLALFTSAGKKLDLLGPMLDRWLHGGQHNVVRKISRIDSGYLCNERHYENVRDLHPDPAYYAEAASARQTEYFERTIVMLQERGIRVMLVNPPLYAEYYGEVRTSRTYRDFQESAERLAREYGLDFINGDDNDLQAKFVAEDFLNGEHLCRTGAVKFSTELAQRLPIRQRVTRR